MGPMDARGFGEGLRDGVAHEEHYKHKDLPCFGALVGRYNPYCSIYPTLVYSHLIGGGYKCSSSCMELAMESCPRKKKKLRQKGGNESA